MYVVFDFETTIIEKYKRKANPLLPENYPVCSGFLYVEKDWDEYTDYHIDRDGQALPDDMFRDADLIVGQNIRFDLMYIWRHPQTIKFFKNGGKVWDIQYAEYLLTAQESTWASLDQMSKKYGLELKPDNIKKYWQAGVCTRDIPQSELLPYQEHDCRNTKEVFIRQWKQAKKLGLLNSIWAHMDGLMALLEMEYNGLAIDKEAKENDQKEIEDRLEEIQEKLDNFIKNTFPDLPFEFNWSSNVHVSALFFGGSVKYTERELIGYCKGYRSIPMVDEFGDPVRIKSGPNKGKFRTVREEYKDLDRPKYKNNEYYYKFKRQTNPQSNWATKVPGVYSVDKYTILVLKNRGSKVAELLAEYNKISKDLSTYYKSIDDVLYPDSIIHHMLNPTVAITGRLSSSNPNLQNLPKGDKSKCRRMFVSRFGAEGKMIEVDEKQLEVVIQAWFSGDENMMKDVNEGVDFHCKRLAYKLSMEYEDVLYKCTVEHDQYFSGMRTKIKTFSFQRAYGAGATAIAAETGLKIAEVKMLENDEKAMYPLIEPFSDDVLAACEASREWTPYKTEQGEEVHRGYYQSLTGKYYSFKTIDLPEYKQKQWVEGEPRTQFYMPQIKNYPIQGGGGEIVIGLLGRLWRKKFLAKDNYGGLAFMVNTVHDCVWADSHDDKVAEVVWDIEEVMTDVQGLFDEYYDGQIVPVKFRVETEVGLNLYEMEHYEH